MKKSLLLMLLMALLAPWTVSAQVVTIGTGTTTHNSAPIANYFNYSLAEMIFTAEEISAGNPSVSTILSLGFEGAAASSKTYEVTIYMKNVDAVSFIDVADFIPVSTSDVVFTGSIKPKAGWNTLDLEVPFTYDNTKSLLVVVNKTSKSYDGSTSIWKYTSTSSTYKMLYAQRDSDPAYDPTTSPSSSLNYERPNVQLTFGKPASCAKPTDLAVSTITSTGASLAWTEKGSATAWQICVNDDESNLMAAGTNPFTISGLTPATSYSVKVRANCGSEQSAWSSAINFVTECEPYAIPFTYNFETPDTFICWNPIVGAAIAESSSYSHSGSKYLKFSGTTNNMIALPQFTSATNTLRVEFWTRPESTGGNSGKFAIGYMTDISDASTFVAVETYNSTEMTTSYVKKIVDFVNAPAGAIIALRQFDCETYYYWFVDDVTVQESPSCLAPTALGAENITTNSADLSWTANSSESVWRLFVKKASEENYVEENGIITNPYTLQGLDPATEYQYYVIAKCGGSDESEPSDAFSFITGCEAIDLSAASWSENFDSYTASAGFLPTCWNRINTCSYSSYDVSNYPRIYANSSYSTYANSAPNCLYLYSSAYYSSYDPQPQYAILPEMTNLAGKQITLQAKGATSTSTFKIGTMTNPADATTFTLIKEQNGLTTSYQEFTYNIPNTTTDSYVAIMIEAADEDRTTNGVYIDDILIANPPACPKPTDFEASASIQTANLSWTSGADNFEIAHSTNATADPEENVAGDSNTNTYSMNSLALDMDHYFWVRANCGTDGNSEWVGPISVHIGYCVPGPTSRDGKGITGVAFGQGVDVVNNSDANGLPNASPYYGDYIGQIGAVQAGVESTIAITTSTGSYPYTFVIWVDFDNDLTFEDDEIIYTGKCASGAGILNANITIPASQALGDYRMRIAGADSYFNSFYNNGGALDYTKDHDPCLTGSKYAVFHDYTLRVLAAPSCLKPSNLAVEANAQSADLSWVSEVGAYSVAHALEATAEPNDNIVAASVSDESYEMNNLALGDHYFWVRANCGGSNGSSDWVGPVSVHIGYCEPAPTSVDKQGITNVTFGVGENIVNNSTHPSTSPYFGDYHTQIGAVQAGVEATISITYATGYTYNTYVWVDLNNNLSFEADEVVAYGESTDANPTTLTLNFTIPATQATGNYRMRIGGADSGLGSTPANANPCYTGTYGTFEDYTLRVLEAPSCLPPTALSAEVNGFGATITWASDADKFNLQYKKTAEAETAWVAVGNIEATSYAIGNLDGGTEYEVQIQANCGSSNSEWSSSVTFTTALCAAEDQCVLTFELTDSYGDSWNGNAIRVTDVLSGKVLGEMANENLNGTTGSGENEVNIKTLSVCNGREIQFSWVTGNYPNETSYVVKDVNGQVIFSGSGAMSEAINYTVDCTHKFYLEIGTSGYATFYDADYAYTMPAKLSGHTFNATTGLSDAIYEANQIIPAKEPLVMKAADDVVLPETFVLVEAETDALPSAGNDLQGNNEEGIIGSATDGNVYYVLSLNAAGEDESVGFYYMLENGVGGFIMPAHKAYLQYSASGAPAQFYLFNGENNATWLENLQGVEGTVKFMHEGNIYILRDSIIYDATGRKVRELK